MSPEPAEPPHEPTHPYPTELPSSGDALMWLGTVIVSGVVGNVAYDLVKTALLKKRWWWPWKRRDRPPAPVDHRLVARLAVQARLGELGHPVPRLEKLTAHRLDPGHPVYRDIGHMVRRPSDAEYTVEARGLWARVEFPEGDLEGRSLKVTIHEYRLPRD